jgi:3-phosphoshikimate 1-carboxyvinyltransferase
MESEGTNARVKGFPKLKAQKVIVPGDISSAAFFMIAGLIVPSSRITINTVGLNPTRDGIIDALQEMGAKLRIFDVREAAGEKIGNIEVETSSLKGISLGGEIIPRLIDEIPVLAVTALFAEGITEIRDAAELKVKESNRISAICEGISRMGGKVEELPDGLRIYGGHPLKGAVCRSFHDHRIAMSLAVAALAAEGDTVIENPEAVEISFPQFWNLLDELRS